MVEAGLFPKTGQNGKTWQGVRVAAYGQRRPELGLETLRIPPAKIAEQGACDGTRLPPFSTQAESGSRAVLADTSCVFLHLWMHLKEGTMVVRADKRCLVLRNGEYQRCLKPGTHWKPWFAVLETYSINEEFEPLSSSIELVTTNETIAAELDLVSADDGQIALWFVDGNFVDVLGPGKHAFWKSARKNSFTIVDLNVPFIDESIDRMILRRRELSEYVAAYSVEPHESGILYIDKEQNEILSPGNYFFWKGSKSIDVTKVDLRQQQIEIAGQDIMTKDRIPVRLSFFCQLRIVDVLRSVASINDYTAQLYVLLQLALREYVGSFSLDEVLAKREEIGSFVKDKLKDQAAEFGVELIHAGIKDVVLPGEIKEILNQVLIAEKKSQANVIMRREETASTRSLLNTAKLLEENKILYHLKELEYIERISEKISQISLNGGGHLIEELKRLFVPENKEDR